jgi:hypothetical protein
MLKNYDITVPVGYMLMGRGIPILLSKTKVNDVYLNKIKHQQV